MPAYISFMESKQKFISQKMTNEIPVCFAKDVDEVVLSFAEVKMFATGDEYFKGKCIWIYTYPNTEC